MSRDGSSTNGHSAWHHAVLVVCAALSLAMLVMALALRVEPAVLVASSERAPLGSNTAAIALTDPALTFAADEVLGESISAPDILPFVPEATSTLSAPIRAAATPVPVPPTPDSTVVPTPEPPSPPTAVPVIPTSTAALVTATPAPVIDAPTSVPDPAVAPTSVPDPAVAPTSVPASRVTPVPAPVIDAASSVPDPAVAPTSVPAIGGVVRGGPPAVVNQIPASAWRWLDANGWRVEWRQGPGPGRLSEAQYATNTIVIWYDAGRSDAIWAGAFAHELGHAVSYVHFSNQQMNEWNRRRGLSSWRWVPGTPNDFSVGEGDFAEAFMSYLLGHQVRSVGGPLSPDDRAWIAVNTPF